MTAHEMLEESRAEKKKLKFIVSVVCIVCAVLVGSIVIKNGILFS